MIAAVYPEGWSEDLADGLALAGAAATSLADLTPENPSLLEADVLVVDLGLQPMRRLREVGQIAEVVGLPILLIAAPEQMTLLESTVGVTDFVVTPVGPVEFRLRLHRLHRSESSDEVLLFKDLVLNPLNYQAALADEPMDLTFMEYELLRFLMGNQGRVWSRQQLLSKVWGYEYYGGARTVDVHIRRLRAKLGEERASWITTVRSVGYRFG
ncbi:MAG: response regulator transcription factor [Actinobacteria bacterium]|nr:response regulator transcription factor [Actinomycetota bacterium]MCZ6630265.1 response regulator transcription factor [Actinomycetota bacterium]MCZ6737248.1 response regulator transcription factor [Actinomycetota bacterium]